LPYDGTYTMPSVQIPGRWNFLIGEPDTETPLGKMPKGTLEITLEKLNAYKDKEQDLSINVRDIKSVAKETKRGTLMVKIVGRNRQVYTFIPLAGGSIDKNAMVEQFIQAVKKVIPPPS
jgi:hypothetical protein